MVSTRCFPGYVVDSPDGQLTACPGDQNTLKIEDRCGHCWVYYVQQDGMFQHVNDTIKIILWTHDSKQLISLSSTGSIHLLTRTALHVRTLRGADGCVAAALHLSPEWKLFAYREEKQIGAWQLWPSSR